MKAMDTILFTILATFFSCPTGLFGYFEKRYFPRSSSNTIFSAAMLLQAILSGALFGAVYIDLFLEKRYILKNVLTTAIQLKYMCAEFTLIAHLMSFFLEFYCDTVKFLITH